MALRHAYVRRVLPWALRHGPLVAGLCALSFFGSMALVPLGVVGEEFIPPTDRGQIFVQTTYPIGTPLSTVRNGMFALERRIRTSPDVFAEATTAGGYSASFGGFVNTGNVGQITIFLKDDRAHATAYWVAQFSQMSKRTLPGAESVVVPSTGTTGGNKQPIDFLVSDVSGGDPTRAAQRLVALLASVPGATSVNGSGTSLAPQISITFDRAKAQALDVSLATAAEAAGAAFGGNVATQFETPQGLESVQVIYPLADQTRLARWPRFRSARRRAASCISATSQPSFRPRPRRSSREPIATR